MNSSIQDQLVAVKDFVINIPPITRTILILKFLLPCFTALGVVNTMQLVLHDSFLIRLFPQVWRLFTFQFFQPSNLFSFVFLLHLIHTISKNLESQCFGSRPHDYLHFIFITTTFLATITSYFDLYIAAEHFNLILISCWSVSSGSHPVNFMFGIPIPGILFPWILLAFDAAQGSYPTIDKFLSIFFGYIYYALYSNYRLDPSEDVAFKKIRNYIVKPSEHLSKSLNSIGLIQQTENTDAGSTTNSRIVHNEHGYTTFTPNSRVIKDESTSKKSYPGKGSKLGSS